MAVGAPLRKNYWFHSRFKIAPNVNSQKRLVFNDCKVFSMHSVERNASSATGDDGRDAVTNRPDEESLVNELRGPPEVFDACLAELRSRGAGILECIKRVRHARGCPLGEATAAVANSPT